MDPAAVAALPAPVRSAYLDGFSAAFWTVFLAAAAVAAVAFALTWLIREVPLRTTVHGGPRSRRRPRRLRRWRSGLRSTGEEPLVRRLVTDVVLPLAVALALAFVVQAALAKPYEIPTGSMEPTIQPDDRVIANRVIYRFRDVERGNIIVFSPPSRRSGRAARRPGSRS